ncbi:MAG: CDP-alcohol phosphatidyltransferase family protein [Gammaproteobacteria bacterium]
MPNPAHLLSLSRMLAAPPAAWALWADVAWLSCTLYAWAVLSDVCDGRLARRRGEASELGTLLDHGADCLFVTLLIATAAARGLLPLALPVLIVFAFARYAWAARLGAGTFRGSRLGRANGIGYFVIAGAALVVSHFDPAPWATTVLAAGGWLVLLSTVVLLMRGPRGWLFAGRHVQRS